MLKWALGVSFYASADFPSITAALETRCLPDLVRTAWI